MLPTANGLMTFRSLKPSSEKPGHSQGEFLLVMVGIEPRASYRQGEFSATELCPQLLRVKIFGPSPTGVNTTVFNLETISVASGLQKLQEAQDLLRQSLSEGVAQHPEF